MGFLEVLKKSTTELQEAQKILKEMNKISVEINSDIVSLGNEVIQLFEKKRIETRQFDERCTLLSEKMKYLRTLTDIYNELNMQSGKIRCYCGAVYSREMKNCSSCGLNVPKSTNSCICGAENLKDAKFCSTCGINLTVDVNAQNHQGNQVYVDNPVNIHNRTVQYMNINNNSTIMQVDYSAKKCVCGQTSILSEKNCRECGRKL